MSPRERLLSTAADLFAQHGFRGASVRAICDRANANPGAISYYFGGKRQLYRAVLRAAAERLTSALVTSDVDDLPLPHALEERALQLHRALERDHTSARLLLRDLADGGEALTEALSPALRNATDAVLGAAVSGDEPGAQTRIRLMLLAVAGPLLLVTAAWPMLQRSLGLSTQSREEVLRALLRISLGGAPPG